MSLAPVTGLDRGGLDGDAQVEHRLLREDDRWHDDRPTASTGLRRGGGGGPVVRSWICGGAGRGR